MTLEYKLKEWLLHSKDKLSYLSPAEELNTYQALFQHFKCLVYEGHNTISVSSNSSLFSGGNQPEWYNVANWSNLDQEFKNQVIIDYFTSGCHAYSKKALNLLPDDIKNYILAHSL